jgi:hypothetical protein
MGGEQPGTQQRTVQWYEIQERGTGLDAREVTELMQTPHFVTLVRIDRQRHVSACRHGLVHLTWERTTIRFSREEFRRLAALLRRAMDATPPASVSDGFLHLAHRLDEDSELRIGSLALLLPEGRLEQLVRMGQEAERRLDEILASGAWDEEPDQPSLLDQLRQTVFSLN